MKCRNCGENISLWQTGYDINGITACYDCYSNNYEELKHLAKQKGETKDKRVTSTNSENSGMDNNKDQWYYSISENEYDGPISAEKLAKKIKSKAVSKNTLIWQTEMDDWQQINQVSEFKEHFDEDTPPPFPKRNQKNVTKAKLEPPGISKSKTTAVDPKKSAREKQKSVNEKPKLTNRWLKFYLYIRIPAIIFCLLSATLFWLSSSQSSEVKIVFLSVILPIIFIYSVLWAGLYRRKRWGYNLNWVFILLEPILGAVNAINRPDQFVLFFLAGLLIYSLPNFFYFKKRKHLFS